VSMTPEIADSLRKEVQRCLREKCDYQCNLVEMALAYAQSNANHINALSLYMSALAELERERARDASTSEASP